jgi:hypothetical protein
MIGMTAAETALLASGAMAEAGLVEIQFSTGVQRLAMWPINIDSGGFTWRGIGDVVRIPATKHAADSAGDSVTLEVTAASAALVALCSGPSYTWRGKRVQFLTQFMTANFEQVGVPRPFWTGVMVGIGGRAEPGQDGTVNAVLSIDLAPLGMSRARTAEGIRWTAAQHRSRYPADAGLDGLAAMLEQTSWLSREYQQSQA